MRAVDWPLCAMLTCRYAQLSLRVCARRILLTANLLDHRGGLLTEQIEALREVTRRAHERHPFRTDAFVVLPDRRGRLGHRSFITRPAAGPA